MLYLVAIALQAASPQVQVPAADPATAVSIVGGRIERGMPVVDRNGELVGNVALVEEDTLLLDTGTRKVAFATSEFVLRAGGLVFPMTKAEVDETGAQIEASIASSRAALLKVGVPVVGVDGALVGRIRSLEPGFVVLDLVPSGIVKMPDHSFASSEGALVIGMTGAQLQEILASM